MDQSPFKTRYYKYLRYFPASILRHPFYTVSPKRSCKKDAWHDSTISLSNDDLRPLARLMEPAFDATDDLYEEGDFSQPESNDSTSSNSGEMEPPPF